LPECALPIGQDGAYRYAVLTSAAVKREPPRQLPFGQYRFHCGRKNWRDYSIPRDCIYVI